MSNEQTDRLGLQLTAAGQSQKHVTVNEALLRLDALVHLAVSARDVVTPPASPADGTRLLLGATPVGIFAGQGGKIAVYETGAWAFLTPQTGWRAYIIPSSRLLIFNGTSWIDPAPALTEIQNLPLLGVGTSADATNPLAVKAGNTLFTAQSAPLGNGDFRMKLNKDSTANVLSQLYQTGYSGRAETGLIGNDNYGIKVSADGSLWKTAITVSAESGVVAFPFGLNGERYGFRNRLINGSGSINQRGVSGTIVLAAGQYGHDRWKAGASGCTYTVTSYSSTDIMFSIQSGSLCQAIEGVNLQEGGTFTLSWIGSALGRVYTGTASPAYAASPVVASGIGAATTIIEFTGGNFSRAQYEPGVYTTEFERLPRGIELALCQRYFEKSYDNLTMPGTITSDCAEAMVVFGSGISKIGKTVAFKVLKRAIPTISVYSPVTGVLGKGRDEQAAADIALTVDYTGKSAFRWMGMPVTPGNAALSLQWVASAEM